MSVMSSRFPPKLWLQRTKPTLELNRHMCTLCTNQVIEKKRKNSACLQGTLEKVQAMG